MRKHRKQNKNLIIFTRNPKADRCVKCGTRTSLLLSASKKDAAWAEEAMGVRDMQTQIGDLFILTRSTAPGDYNMKMRTLTAALAGNTMSLKW
jgi:hypothetical protein